jgi:hypothetical protein
MSFNVQYEMVKIQLVFGRTNNLRGHAVKNHPHRGTDKRKPNKTDFLAET